jgi:hypothetical protein
MLLCCPGKRKALPLRWDDLCADVRPLILDKMSLRHLAHAAPTSQEFHKRFSVRMAEERTRLVSLVEDLYGKEQFYGFVKAFRRLLRDWDVYPGLSPRGDNTLLINSAGEAEVVSEEEVGKEWERTHVGCNLLCLRRASASWRPTSLMGGLWSGRLGTGPIKVTIDVRRTSAGALEWEISGFEEKGHEAAMGLVLALLREDPGDLPASWHTPPKRVTLDLEELLGDAGKRVAEDLVGPLRFQAEFVTYKRKCYGLSVVLKPL